MAYYQKDEANDEYNEQRVEFTLCEPNGHLGSAPLFTMYTRIYGQ